jgi:hypothetical protein
MDQPVVVTLLGGREVRRRAQVTNASAWGVGIEMQCPVARGALLRIDFGEAVALGEVLHCREAAGAYYVGVKLDQALKSVADLALELDRLERQAARGVAQAP